VIPEQCSIENVQCVVRENGFEKRKCTVRGAQRENGFEKLMYSAV
jgi:hypothetical protein